MRRLRWIAVGCLLVLIAAGVVAYWLDALPLPAVEDGDYPTRPVSALVESDRLDLGGVTPGEPVCWNAASGEDVIWAATKVNWKIMPDRAVRIYPKLRSTHPLYGAIEFGKGRIKAGQGSAYRCVVDESAGTGTGYDRLYFDANGDLDLTNDPVVTPMTPQPSPTPGAWQRGKSTAFDPLTVSFDFGAEYGCRPVQILPWLTESDGDESQIAMRLLVSQARKGRIQIGRRRFDALLCQLFRITGRFDKPDTTLHLTTTGLFGREPRWQWAGGEELSAFRLVDGRLYTINTTPSGDTLMVRRYRGASGLLRIDPGKRSIADVRMSGWLRAKTATVPVGRMPEVAGDLQSVRECSIPVGDYRPSELTFRYGRLSFWLTENYHTDGKWHGALLEDRWVYSIKIRKDRPFVLDFSNRPEVLFLSPANAQRFKAGEEVVVETVLTDPVLSTMIRGLDDTSRKERRKNGDGTIERNLSLEPTVKILDSAGNTLASGTMPFG